MYNVTLKKKKYIKTLAIYLKGEKKLIIYVPKLSGK